MDAGHDASTGAELQVDHLVYATPDLDEGVQRIARLLGVTATPGGQHMGRGTRNALVALGPRAYLEIVGPDTAQPVPESPRWFDIDTLIEPRLVTWAAAAPDISDRAARAEAAGFSVGAIGEGRRTRADGVELSWRFTDPRMSIAGGIVPFLIDWGNSPHPATDAAAGGELVGFRGEHPDPFTVQQYLHALRLEVSIRRAAAPALIATICTARGDVELR